MGSMGGGTTQNFFVLIFCFFQLKFDFLRNFLSGKKNWHPNFFRNEKKLIFKQFSFFLLIYFKDKKQMQNGF